MPPNKDVPEGNNNSRCGWSPLLVKVKETHCVVVLWKNYRGMVNIYNKDRRKDSILGKVLNCQYQDGNFNVTDDLGQTVKLPEKQLDMSIIGGENKLAVQISMLRSRGELGGIAELITFLGRKPETLSSPPTHEFTKLAMSESKVMFCQIIFNDTSSMLPLVSLISNIIWP